MERKELSHTEPFTHTELDMVFTFHMKSTPSTTGPMMHSQPLHRFENLPSFNSLNKVTELPKWGSFAPNPKTVHVCHIAWFRCT